MIWDNLFRDLSISSSRDIMRILLDKLLSLKRVLSYGLSYKMIWPHSHQANQKESHNISGSMKNLLEVFLVLQSNREPLMVLTMIFRAIMPISSLIYIREMNGRAEKISQVSSLSLLIFAVKDCHYKIDLASGLNWADLSILCIWQRILIRSKEGLDSINNRWMLLIMMILRIIWIVSKKRARRSMKD